jgi:hypothetical protein
MRTPTTSAAIALALVAASCQSVRELRVTSEPSQAEVRLDGEHVGTTPCHIPFEHYGTRRVTVYLPGFRTYSKLIEIAPPWYARFPLDVFTEVLVPIGLEDVHVVHVPLLRGGEVLFEPDLPSVLGRADTLRHAGPDGPVAKPGGGGK